MEIADETPEGLLGDDALATLAQHPRRVLAAFAKALGQPVPTLRRGLMEFRAQQGYGLDKALCKKLATLDLAYKVHRHLSLELVVAAAKQLETQLSRVQPRPLFPDPVPGGDGDDGGFALHERVAHLEGLVGQLKAQLIQYDGKQSSGDDHSGNGGVRSAKSGGSELQRWQQHSTRFGTAAACGNEPAVENKKKAAMAADGVVSPFARAATSAASPFGASSMHGMWASG